MRAHTSTESSSVALWHAFGITAVVLSERGGGGGKCLYLVLPLLPSFSPGGGRGGSEGRENAEVETRQRGREERA